MEAAKDAVAHQADVVRDLKANKNAKPKDVDAAVAKLNELKAKLKVFTDEVAEKKAAISKFRAGFEDLLLRKFFYVPAFEIYGGVAGLYDYGPPGCGIKANLLSLWRQHFVLTENMLEVSCTVMTPDVVLRTSGHVDKFTDFMVKDTKTGDCLRADKILEDFMDKLIDEGVSEEKKSELLEVRTQAGAYSKEKLTEALRKYNVVAPDTKNPISDPFPFNLMFVTSIGPTGKLVGYLRPETAQGIFVNFRRLLEYNNGRMPFAAAQIGMAFRNEIAPRSGLLRVREFEMAEIEHFVNPKEKEHPSFQKVFNYELSLLSREDQTGEDIARTTTIGKAVKTGMVNNETLGYFIARVHMFLVKAGVDPKRLRFRQHKSNEMAHYAQDCWDAEIHGTYGWIECVGIADRAAYDLSMHTNVSKVDLSAEKMFAEPKLIEVCEAKIDKGKLGKDYRQDASKLIDYLKNLERKEALALDSKLAKSPQEITVDGKKFKIDNKTVKFEVVTKKISVEKYLPGVIEPSFGIGRILYHILEHSYAIREKNGEQQSYLSLSPTIAPIKVALLPLSSGKEFDAMVEKFEAEFIELSLATKVDNSGASIGRKYARADEVGVPLDITLDFDSIKDNTVTIRERDSTEQVRLNANIAADVCDSYIKGRKTWAQIRNEHKKV